MAGMQASKRGKMKGRKGMTWGGLLKYAGPLAALGYAAYRTREQMNKGEQPAPGAGKPAVPAPVQAGQQLGGISGQGAQTVTGYHENLRRREDQYMRAGGGRVGYARGGKAEVSTPAQHGVTSATSRMPTDNRPTMDGYHDYGFAKGGMVCAACGGKMARGGKCMKCGGTVAKGLRKAMRGGGKAHPGFKAVAAKIGRNPNIRNPNAVLAAATRRASPAAKRANPRLKRVPGA